MFARMFARMLACVLLAAPVSACAGGLAPAGGPFHVEGQVTDDRGDPVEDAQVSLSDASAGALTDSSGAYRFELPGAGTYKVRAARVGLAPDSATVRVSAPSPSARADFTLRQASPCEGPCYDSRGNPIACC